MAESPQLLRQWKILQLLETSRIGVTLAELVQEAEVSEKTIRRDLKVLQSVFDIQDVSGPAGRRWKMDSLSDQMGFTLTELMSIYLSQQFLEPLAGTPFWQGNRRVFQRIQGSLGEAGVRYLGRLSACVLSTNVGAGSYEHRGDLIDELMVAIEDRNVTLIVYRSMQSTEPVEQEVYPLGLIHHRGRLYLIAWSSRREEVRNFKVDRIEEVESQKLRFAIPQDFDLSDWLAKSFGVWRSGREDLQVIRVRFAPQSARYVLESKWHESQTFESQPDGSVVAEFHLPDTTEIKRWIMSFGPNAEVLGPEGLQKDIIADLREMILHLEVNERA